MIFFNNAETCIELVGEATEGNTVSKAENFVWTNKAKAGVSLTFGLN